MAKVALTQLGLQSIAPPERGQKSFWDKLLPSFGVRVSQGGSKTFVLNRGNTLITIGRYPVVSLSAARGEAKRLLAEFTLGHTQHRAIAYETAVEQFLEDKARTKKARTVAEYTRLLARFRFKGKLADVSHADALAKLARISSASERSHVTVVAKIFFNWCIKRRYLTHHPLAGVSAGKSKKRARILTPAEIKAVWVASDQCGTFGCIVKLLFLTAQRRGEIAALQTSWIQDNHITLPSEITKNGREHTFPIGNTTRAVLATVSIDKPSTNSAIYFPARGKPSSPFNGWSKSKQALDQLSGTSGWTLHDIRRTVATNMGELGVSPHVIERILNHISGQISGVAATYNWASYMPEMAEAFRLWESRLTSIVG